MDQLYWSPHHAIHSRLQSAAFVRDPGSKAAIDEHFDWLLKTFAQFKGSNEASRKHVSERLRVDVKGKGIKFEEKHRVPALKLARLLVGCGFAFG